MARKKNILHLLIIGGLRGFIIPQSINQKIKAKILFKTHSLYRFIRYNTYEIEDDMLVVRGEKIACTAP